MIVGFTILDFKGRKKSAVDFINRVCVLENPEIAQNIVDLGVGVNIFAKGLTMEILNAQPFKCAPIEVESGEHLVVSAVDFNLELPLNRTIVRLRPTEYIRLPMSKALQFEEYYKLGLIKVIPDVDWSGDLWLLQNGTWDDEGVWIDDDSWED